MKRAHVAATLVALALVLPSCGGDSQSSSASRAGSTGQSEQAQTDSQPGAKDTSKSHQSSQKSRNGDGGSSAADAERAAAADDRSKNGPSGISKQQQKKKSGADASPTPAQRIEDLSAKERRRLDRDLYKQGKDYCYAFGPKQLAAEYHIAATDPAAIAERFARVRQQALPALILPFKQGCLAGFRKWARNPPESPAKN
jgi:hypothetical protein